MNRPLPLIRRPALPWLTALVALIAIAGALAMLWRADGGVRTERVWLGTTPVTVYRPAVEVLAHPEVAWDRDGGVDGVPRLPVVVISHGFAGSQQLMQPFAVTLARNGYLAVTFDYYGHGRNGEPLGGDVTRVEGSTRFLLAQTRAVVDYALALPDAGPGLALLGHSMASDLVVRYADGDARVEATIAVSLFSPAVTADSPVNFLVIVGALEGFLKREALRVLGQVTEAPRAGVTFGDFSEGTARRAVFAPGVEHVGVLYSRTALREAVDWLDRAFGRPPGANTGYVDVRGLAVPLLLGGLVLLAWPLSRLLPAVAVPAAGFAPRWRELLPAALLPALATPLLLTAFPADFMGVLVGGYLAVHFGLYGSLTALCTWWLGERRKGGQPQPVRRRPGAAWLAAALATIYGAGLIGLALDRYVTSFAVTAHRLPLLGVMAAGTACYFFADEWLTRGVQAPRGAQLLTRICFLASLGLAVALSFEDLFFLLIIAAVIVPWFLLYGLLGLWVYRATGQPWVSAAPGAVAFGWTLAVVFPQLSG